MDEQKQFKECGWLLRFYDNRRHNPELSDMQREIAENCYQTYYKLYNAMYIQMNKED